MFIRKTTPVLKKLDQGGCGVYMYSNGVFFCAGHIIFHSCPFFEKGNIVHLHPVLKWLSCPVR